MRVDIIPMGFHRTYYAFPTLVIILLIAPTITRTHAESASTAAAAASSSSTTKSFPITTLINAKWSQTPLHLEIAEFLADENAGHYWDFIEGLANLETPLNEYDTESKQYNTAINVVRKKLSSMQLPLLKLVVAMHSLTPRIQTHFQIASEVLRRGNCASSATFVQIGSELACNAAQVQKKLARTDDPSLDVPVETYSFDHIYPGSENISRTVVLYGDLASREFASTHKYLVEQAINGKVRYIARHHLVKMPERRVRLSGYGVELHLKSTEYKSQDDSPKPTDNDHGNGDDSASEGSADDNEVHGFDFTVLKARHPSLSHSLDKFRQSLLQGSEEIAQLKAWQFQDLGLQAAAAIASIKGEEALQILQFTAQNFPMQTRALLGQKVSDELREEVKHNTEVLGRSLNIVPPDGALFVNGLFFDADTMDLGALVETLRSEVRVMEALEKNNVRGPVATALLGLDLSATGGREFAIDIRDSAIVWVNNIESDPQYRRWPSSVMDLLRPTFPGMLRNIRKNVFNVVIVVDPVEPGRTRDLLKMAESFIVHNAPVRLGLVFDGRQADDSTEDVYVALMCVFNYVTQHKDARYALNFLNTLYGEISETAPLKIADLRNNLKNSFKSLSNKNFEEIIEEGSNYDYGRQLGLEFVERLGFANSPQVLLNGVPMQSHLLGSDSDFEEAVFSDILQQTTTLQKAVYREELTDGEDIMDYLMNQPHVMPRLNQRILSTENNRYLDLTGTANENLGNVRGLAQLSNRDMTATLLDNIKYFGGKHATERIGNADLHFLTLWVFADLEVATGREVLMNALQYVKAGNSVRVAFIPNTEGATVGAKDNLNRLVWSASQTLTPTEATDVVLKWLKQWPKAPQDIPDALNDILPSTELHMKMLRVYAQRVLELRKSEILILGNGKVYGPLNKDEKFSIEDFGLIDRLSTFQYGDKIRKVLKKTVTSASDTVELKVTSDTLLKLYASLVSRQSKTRFKLPVDLKSQHSMVQLAAKDLTLPQIDITAIIDPASRSAQRVAPILIVLRQMLNCRMSVYLTPVSQHSDMPVKNFYRYVVEPEVSFEPNGRMSDGPYAKFTGVPANPLLTQNLQVPDNWLVEAVRAVYDLDNIKLSEIGGPVHSEYELEYLLLEGHCFDAANGSPPRGLQVTLGTKDRPVMVDTIVMANLGYFQLKANPGAWELRLRDGKSSDIYDITYAEGPNTVHFNHTTKVVISSMRSHVIKLRVSKKPGKQNADLLSEDDEQASSSIWNSIASSFGGGSTEGADDGAETINIFSVASGHLYERLLRIMMVSLLKHTKSPVKFWFLKNYLSPQFNDLLPHMAREYGFQYELVQYKWPRWLHQQTEKQRIIWGYKILFLDVLFPLNVRKIIFVDADAIVRSDIKELYDMDLGGAPYAYTPFCDSRKEMEGFRFWKQGYWRNHLMGRRYHISALYVVDLKRFRRIAAGDRLRGQYQALSQDPNSLSNLDQDLPNNMIHQVAIKSLPSEWLWCQTWCSDSSFKTAKVIDLCNNPMTKEAKLTAAQRIVPEWKDYDAEIKGLQAKIEDHENSEYHESALKEEKKQQPAAAAADKQEHSTSQHSEL